MSEYTKAAEKGKAILAKQTNQPEYRTATGRRRYNTMLHPELVELLAAAAKGKGVTVPDLIEEIVSKAFGITEPSKQ